MGVIVLLCLGLWSWRWVVCCCVIRWLSLFCSLLYSLYRCWLCWLCWRWFVLCRWICCLRFVLVWFCWEWRWRVWRFVVGVGCWVDWLLCCCCWCWCRFVFVVVLVFGWVCLWLVIGCGMVDRLLYWCWVWWRCYLNWCLLWIVFCCWCRWCCWLVLGGW